VYRIIYCPDETFLDEASVLSAELSLSILLGDNDRTSSLDFDRSSVSVVTVPDTNRFTIRNSLIPVGMAAVFDYDNDFSNLSKSSVVLLVSHGGTVDMVKPDLTEARRCRFMYRPKQPGTYEVTLVMDGLPVFPSETFEVE